MDNLFKGDVAILVGYVPHPAGAEAGAVLEIFNAIIAPISVATVLASADASLRTDQMSTVLYLTLAF